MQSCSKEEHKQYLKAIVTVIKKHPDLELGSEEIS